MTNCEALHVSKSIRRQSEQICLKIFILILSCSTLCLVCFCVENYRQKCRLQHSSEKLIQYEDIFEHKSPWIERAEESRKPRSKELFFQEGSGAEPTSAEIENGWSKKEDNLESLYTTVVDENFNVWKDNSNIKGEDVFEAKETIGLEEYIAQHKSQTIDTSAEQATSPKPTTELCQHESAEEETTASIENHFIELNAPIETLTTTEKPALFNSEALSEDSTADQSDSQSERFASMLKTEKPYIEHHIVATPPRPIKSAENYHQPHVWFTDDYEDFEKFIAHADNENRAQLEQFYEPQEILSEEVYKTASAEIETPYHQQQPYNHYDTDYETDYGTHSMLLPDEHTPRFIEQLLGNLNRMSNIFAPLPAPTLRPAYNPYSRNNHLSNFHQTYDDPDQQFFASNHHKKIKHKPKVEKHYSNEDMDSAESGWYRRKPSTDIRDVIKLLKVLFQKQIIE